jgi:hypothetical protein
MSNAQTLFAGSWYPADAATQLGYGAPAAGPWQVPPHGSFPPAQPSDPTRWRRKLLWLSAIAVVIALVIAAAATVAYVVHNNSDPVKIRALVDDFSAAVYGGKPRDIANHLCAEEAQSYLDTIEEPDTPAGAQNPPAFSVSDIHVKGDVASATVTFESDGTKTMYFRKEDNRWTVCASAEGQV